MPHLPLYCYNCRTPVASYTCPHCGSEDVEAHNTDDGSASAEARLEAIADAKAPQQ